MSKTRSPQSKIKFPNRWVNFICVLITTASIGISLPPPSSASAAESQGVLDAKRDAAKKMARDGKTIDAISLWQEVIAGDGSNAKDYLNLARLQDKLNKPETKSTYKKFMELSATPHDVEERQGRGEAEKRIKAMDVMGTKVDSAIEAFSAKLDAMEKEAIASRDRDAYERIFRLRGALIHSEKPPGAGFVEVSPTTYANTNSEMHVNKGDRLHVYARGTWRVNKTKECTPGGITGKGSNGHPLWALSANVDGKGYYEVGEEAVITVTDTGTLLFNINCDTNSRPECGGTVMVLIRKE